MSVSDNGAELTSNAILRRCSEHQAELVAPRDRPSQDVIGAEQWPVVDQAIEAGHQRHALHRRALCKHVQFGIWQRPKREGVTQVQPVLSCGVRSTACTMS